MQNLKEASKVYEPKKTLNISDLDKVDLSWPIETRSGTTTEKNPETNEDYEKSYSFKVMVVNTLEYRVPNSVFEEIQKMLKLVPELQFVKVSKTGSGMGTKYSVDKWEEESEEEVPVEKITQPQQQ